MAEHKRSNLRTIVRGAYDVQELRIQMGNRIVSNFKAKLGQKPGKPEKDMDAEEKKFLAVLRTSFKKLTDGVANFPQKRNFKGDEVISTYTELCLVSQYLDLESHERDHFRRLGVILKEYPIYTEFLEGVRGVGPAMAGVIISEFDIAKARYPSSLWKYAGLDLGGDGRGRSRRKEHLDTYEYTDRGGKKAKRQGITFNPFLKTKLTGVLASSFLRAGKDGKYAQEYYGYKHRLENHPVHKNKSKGHRHNMAMRYMVKRFLADLYNAWRPLEGLPVAPEYSEGKLGMRHKDAS